MIRIDDSLSFADLLPDVDRLFALSGKKILALAASWRQADGAPVYTVNGRYTSRGWTEWTQGFQHGSALLQYDATGDEQFLRLGLEGTCRQMPVHLSHTGVHDHGFNTISTYGNLWRLLREQRMERDPWLAEYVSLAIKVSGAVQAARWTTLHDATGFIHSFNGPHSLFIDTVRTLRVLALAHQLGQVLMGENDRRISLLERAVQHARNTARYAVYYGTGRDAYDVPGRVAHECLFNCNDGRFRCPSTQQGYSPFSTWTRGLAWAIAGFAELAEYFAALAPDELGLFGGQSLVLAEIERPARVTADFFIHHSPTDGIPYWDTGAPGLVRLGDYLDRPADPFNEWEPVDSSAAAIAAQGLLRLGRLLEARGEAACARRYTQAGLTVARTLMREPYLATDTDHQGLLLHTVYHRPNGWDFVPPGCKVPCGEAAMWGDYHLRELALLIRRCATSGPWPVFFDAS